MLWDVDVKNRNRNQNQNQLIPQHRVVVIKLTD
jgi:uncharacterized protein (UPF0248 family)